MKEVEVFEEFDNLNGNKALSEADIVNYMARDLKRGNFPEIHNIDFGQENTDDPDFRFDVNKMSEGDLDLAAETFDRIFGRYGFYDLQLSASRNNSRSDVELNLFTSSFLIEVFPNGRGNKGNVTSPGSLMTEVPEDKEQAIKACKATILWAMTDRSVIIIPRGKMTKSYNLIRVPKISPNNSEKSSDAGTLFDNPHSDAPKADAPMTVDELNAAWIHVEAMEQSRKALAADLRKDLEFLRSTHENVIPGQPLSEEEARRSKHYYGKKDTETYKDVVRSLARAIHTLEDDTKTPEETENALMLYKQKSDLMLFESRLSVFPQYDPRRLEIARSGCLKTDSMIDELRNLNYSLITPQLPAAGHASLADVRQALEERTTEAGAENPSLLQDKQFQKKVSAHRKNIIDRNKAQKEFLAQLRKTSRLKFKVGPGALDPDAFLPKLYRPNGYECALNLMTKDYLVKAFSPDTTADMLKEMTRNLKNSVFLKEVDKLATDPVFKDFAKKNSSEIYGKYKPILQKIRNMQQELRNKYINAMPTVDDYDKKARDSFMVCNATAQLLLDSQGFMAMEGLAMGRVSKDVIMENVRAALDSRHFFEKDTAGMRSALRDPNFMKQLKKDLLKKQNIFKKRPVAKAVKNTAPKIKLAI